MKCLPLFVVLLLCVGLMSTAALADAPPPLGYVERCTIKNIEKNAGDCSSCQGDRQHSNDGGCAEEESLKSKGYIQICQTRGASAWTEVWCKNPPGQTLYKEGEVPGCGGCNQNHPERGAMWFLPLLVLGFFMMLRRR